MFNFHSPTLFDDLIDKACAKILGLKCLSLLHFVCLFEVCQFCRLLIDVTFQIRTENCGSSLDDVGFPCGQTPEAAGVRGEPVSVRPAALPAVGAGRPGEPVRRPRQDGARPRRVLHRRRGQGQ